jgi:hypothetical protein
VGVFIRSPRSWRRATERWPWCSAVSTTPESQLLINLTGIVLAAYLVLLARGHSRVTDDQPDRPAAIT